MEDLYQKYYKGIRGYISRKVNDEGTVEELVNDTLLAAMASISEFKGKCNEFSYICSIANHKVVDYYRKKKIKTILFSTNPIFEEVADKALSPERDVLKTELKQEIEATFSDMKEGYSKLLRLKYVEGWKVSKIAEMMAMSVKAVESKLIRAKRQFQQKWNYDRQASSENLAVDNTDRR